MDYIILEYHSPFVKRLFNGSSKKWNELEHNTCYSLVARYNKLFPFEVPAPAWKPETPLPSKSWYQSLRENANYD